MDDKYFPASTTLRNKKGVTTYICLFQLFVLFTPKSFNNDIRKTGYFKVSNNLERFNIYDEKNDLGQCERNNNVL